eukprot:364784-Chlamydomonas_euryale.AAC.2
MANFLGLPCSNTRRDARGRVTSLQVHTILYDVKHMFSYGSSLHTLLSAVVHWAPCVVSRRVSHPSQRTRRRVDAGRVTGRNQQHVAGHARFYAYFWGGMQPWDCCCRLHGQSSLRCRACIHMCCVAVVGEQTAKASSPRSRLRRLCVLKQICSAVEMTATSMRPARGLHETFGPSHVSWTLCEIPTAD